MAYCTSCGSELSTTAKFCNNCGTPIQTATSDTAQSTVPEQQPLVTPQEPLQVNITPTAPIVEQPQPQISPQPAQPTPQPIPQQPAQPVQPQATTTGQWPPQPVQAQSNSGSWPPSNVQQVTQVQQPSAPVQPVAQPIRPVQPKPQMPAQAQPIQQQTPPQNQWAQPTQAQTTPPPVQPQVRPQQNFTPQANANGGATTKKPPNKLIFLVIGLVVMAIIFFSVVIFVISSIFGSSDEDIKFYTATEITMFGMAMSPTDIYEDGIAMELNDNGKCTLIMDGEEFKANWEVDGTEFILKQGSDEFAGTLEGDTLKIINILDTGLDITFVLDGADGISGGAFGGMTGGNAGTANFVAPGYGTEQTFAAETLALPSDWYGVGTISNYKGTSDISGEYEAWAYIGEDDNGVYFELYLNGTYADDDRIDLMSFNIELHDYSFFPVVDGFDWLYNGASLKEEDNTWFNPVLQNGVLSASYDYDYQGETFTVDFELSQIGTAPTAGAGTGGEVGGAQTATGDFDFSMENLWAVYESGDLSDLETFDEITAYFGGIEPIYDVESFEEGDTLLPYNYYASDNPEASIQFGFKEEDGVLMKKSVSTNIRYFIEG